MLAEFLNKSIEHMAHPTFYQYVIDVVFFTLIKAHLSPTCELGSSGSLAKMTFEEANALRYVAGYVCMKVRNNLE